MARSITTSAKAALRLAAKEANANFEAWVKRLNASRPPNVVVVDGDNRSDLIPHLTCPALIVMGMRHPVSKKAREHVESAPDVVLETALVDCKDSADMTAAFRMGQLTQMLTYTPRVVIASQDKAFQVSAAQMTSYRVKSHVVDTQQMLESAMQRRVSQKTLHQNPMVGTRGIHTKERSVQCGPSVRHAACQTIPMILPYPGGLPLSNAVTLCAWV